VREIPGESSDKSHAIFREKCSHFKKKAKKSLIVVSKLTALLRYASFILMLARPSNFVIC
jgi:hypothetical protein